MAELRNGGTSSRAITSAARTMLAASRSGTEMDSSGANAESTCSSAASTSSMRSTSSQGRSISGVVGSGTLRLPAVLRAWCPLGAKARHRVDEILHGCRGILERGKLLFGQREFDDLSHSLPPQLNRHADEQTVDSVLTLKVDTAGQHAPLVKQDRVDHLHDRRPWRLVGTPGLQQCNDFGAAIGGPLFERFDLLRFQDLGDRHAGNGRIA